MPGIRRRERGAQPKAARYRRVALVGFLLLALPALSVPIGGTALATTSSSQLFNFHGEVVPGQTSGWAFVATGENFPDALAAAAAAGASGAPVILTVRHRLLPEAVSALGATRPHTIFVIGGASVLSEEIPRALRGLSWKPNVIRIAGQNRYDTASQVASRFFPRGPERVFCPATAFFPLDAAVEYGGTAVERFAKTGELSYLYCPLAVSGVQITGLVSDHDWYPAERCVLVATGSSETVIAEALPTSPFGAGDGWNLWSNTVDVHEPVAIRCPSSTDHAIRSVAVYYVGQPNRRYVPPG